jgi:hypothetical protein
MPMVLHSDFYDNKSLLFVNFQPARVEELDLFIS